MDSNEFETLVSRIEQNKSEQTARKYVQKLKQFRSWLEGGPSIFEDGDYRAKDLEDAGVYEIERWLTELNDEYAASTVRLAKSALVAGYEELNELIATGEIDGEEWGKQTPADIAEAPTSGRPDRNRDKSLLYLKPEDVQQLADSAASVRDALIISLLYTTGMRATELCSIRLSDLDLKEQSIHIPEGKAAERTVRYQEPVDELLRQWLEEGRPTVYYADESPYLFPTKHSEQMSPQTVRDIIRRAGKRADVQPIAKVTGERTSDQNINPSILRHSFAIALLDNGWRLQELKHALGHQDVATTATLYDRDDGIRDSAEDGKPGVSMPREISKAN